VSATVADLGAGRALPAGLGEMSLLGHLGELRKRAVKCALAIGAGAVIAWFLYPQIVAVLVHPYRVITTDATITGGRLLATDPLEGFATRLKIATYGGIALAMPVILWQIWQFITPGLYRNEKRYATRFVAAGVVLFFMGAGIAYWTLPQALSWLIGVGGSNIVAAYSPAKYLQLILYMMLAFGICFEFPILLTFVQMAGIVPNATLRRHRRQAIVAITVVVAVATPSNDPVSMLALSVPLVIFYELSMQLGRLHERKARKAADGRTRARS
jgi:sec-independent protein translocase protein TatC